MVQPILHRIRLLADILLLLALAHGSSLLVQSLFLLCFSLRLVLIEQLESLGGGVTVEGIGELGDGGRDFKAEIEDLLLALESDVFRPLYHAR